MTKSAVPLISKTPHVVVAGAGAGGLTAALELAAAGASVSLFEKNGYAGGKIYASKIAGKRIDMGPTVLTMRWVFDTVYGDVGLCFDDFVTLAPAEIVARHAWEDGSRLDLFPDEERSRDAVSELASPREADAYVAFSRYAKRIYEHAYRTFLVSDGPGLRDMAAAGSSGVLSSFRIDAFRTMHRALRSFFRDPRLIQLFSRYATYYGASPYQAPATLHLIAEVERQGVWLPRGGMSSVAEALVRAAESFGARIVLGTGVRHILSENGRVSGVVLDNDDVVRADAVVWNGDAAALSAGALGPSAVTSVRRRKAQTRSLSALVTGFVARTEGFPLSSHNVFFHSRDYRLEFDDIFQRRRLPAFPTVYVRAQDRDPGEAPEGGERLFTIINAPAALGDDDALSDKEIERCIEAQTSLFEKIGLRILDQSEAIRITPFAFAKRFPGTGGAIYGPLIHSPFAALRRESARSRMPGLYLAGGSVHPGAGVPMAALSGRQAARAVLSDLGLKAPSSLRDMPGGTSTGSVMMSGTG